jgi:hypothetical protein
VVARSYFGRGLPNLPIRVISLRCGIWSLSGIADIE